MALTKFHRTKCHRTKCHRTKCHRTKSHRMKCHRTKSLDEVSPDKVTGWSVTGQRVTGFSVTGQSHRTKSNRTKSHRTKCHQTKGHRTKGHRTKDHRTMGRRTKLSRTMNFLNKKKKYLYLESLKYYELNLCARFIDLQYSLDSENCTWWQCDYAALESPTCRFKPTVYLIISYLSININVYNYCRNGFPLSELQCDYS